MGKGLCFVGGVGIGAATMYALDPANGRRRRTEVRQTVVHGAHGLGGEARRVSRDFANRGRGLFASARTLADRAPVPDELLVERVRAKLGRVSTHPGAISVVAKNGIVELDGVVLAKEASKVGRGIARVRGVRHVVNRLEAHEDGSHVPALQGAGKKLIDVRPGESLKERLLAGGGGLLLTLFGAKRAGFSGLLLGGVGLGLIGCALTAQPVPRPLARRGVEVTKTIRVDASVDEVFALWSNLESFPRFMTHVKAVTRAEEGRYHWVVDGPGGTSVTWTAEVTAIVPNEKIAWHTVEGAEVSHEGTVRFRPDGRGGTEVQIRLAYRPPAGVIGHGIAALLQAHPKKQLDDDMLRFKSLVETGKATGREETVTRDEVGPGSIGTHRT